MLDLLASLEDGFSIAEKITTRSLESKNSELSGNAEFGINSILNFIKLDFKGSGSRNKGQQSEQSHDTERYHTYGSLLNKLRRTLLDKGLLQTINSVEKWKTIKPAAFVEVKGKFLPNPVREPLETISKVFDFMFAINDILGLSKNADPNIQTQMQNLRKVIEIMKKDFEHEKTKTFIVNVSESYNFKIVLSLFADYIRDYSGRELPYGEFRILGKVVRTLEAGESIDLIRGSAMSGMMDDKLKILLDSFKELQTFGINTLPIQTKVNAPAAQIIPVAIYV